MNPIVIPTPHDDRRARRSSAALVPGILFLVGAPLTLAGVAYVHDTLAGERAAAEMARMELKETRARLAALAGEAHDLERDRARLASAVQQKDGELAALRATYEELEAQLQGEIGRGEVRLVSSGGRITVDMVDQILFESGEATLSEGGEALLQRVGGVLARLKDRQVQVSGHTDDSPPIGATREAYPTNWELSVARAVTVVRYLGEETGVPPRRLVAAGYGQFHPVGNNATHQGRARNRRIEILLTPLVEVRPSPKLSAQVTAGPGRS